MTDPLPVIPRQLSPNTPWVIPARPPQGGEWESSFRWNPASEDSSPVLHLQMPATGTLILGVWCARPLQIWHEDHLLLDEPLCWRNFQRELVAVVFTCLEEGPASLRFQCGPLPSYPRHLDSSCPSRNRARVMADVRKILPDELHATCAFVQGPLPSGSIRAMAGHFERDGLHFQEFWLREAPQPFGKSTTHHSPWDEEPIPWHLKSAHGPGENVLSHGGRKRVYVPLAASADLQTHSGRVGGSYPEPRLAQIAEADLAVNGPSETLLTLRVPVYEPLGSVVQAPARGHSSPQLPDALPVPHPHLTGSDSDFLSIYDEAWEMIRRLYKPANPESGIPGAFVRTGSLFPHHQFLWDTAFTTLCTAYAHRDFPSGSGLDFLYSRQFRSGYIHRETDLRDGLPALFEPDYSPNPPLLSLAEWNLARHTGSIQRLETVYPGLVAYHRWIQQNRRLPNGTYWTTGLANGLDNSPSLGLGYPDLTAQMAHDARTLGHIANLLGRPEEAGAWMDEATQTMQALDRFLWSDAMGFYSTSLDGGGHNPNKVITGFWPLFAGRVEPYRLSALKAQAANPETFWRPHPFPSLAADAPDFESIGRYWRGSTWGPTNYVTILGFWNHGEHEFAREAARRHLRAIHTVFLETGKLWENYASESFRPGKPSMPDYCWTALGPVNLLLEVILGIEMDALNNRVTWNPEPGREVGMKDLHLGDNRISLQFDGRDGITVDSKKSFELLMPGASGANRQNIPAGGFSFRLSCDSNSSLRSRGDVVKNDFTECSVLVARHG